MQPVLTKNAPSTTKNLLTATLQNSTIVYNNKYYKVFIILGSSKEECKDQRNLELVVGRLNEIIKRKPSNLDHYDFKKLSFTSDKIAMECADGSVKNYQINEDPAWRSFYRHLIESQQKGKQNSKPHSINNNNNNKMKSEIIEVEEEDFPEATLKSSIKEKKEEKKEEFLDPNREAPIIDE